MSLHNQGCHILMGRGNDAGAGGCGLGGTERLADMLFQNPQEAAILADARPASLGRPSGNPATGLTQRLPSRHFGNCLGGPVEGSDSKIEVHGKDPSAMLSIMKRQVTSAGIGYDSMTHASHRGTGVRLNLFYRR